MLEFRREMTLDPINSPEARAELNAYDAAVAEHDRTAEEAARQRAAKISAGMRGKRNAAKGDEPRDTPFNHRLPASIVERWKAEADRLGISVPDLLIRRAPRRR